jgi:hypothetical protein
VSSSRLGRAAWSALTKPTTRSASRTEPRVTAPVASPEGTDLQEPSGVPSFKGAGLLTCASPPRRPRGSLGGALLAIASSLGERLRSRIPRERVLHLGPQSGSRGPPCSVAVDTGPASRVRSTWLVLPGQQVAPCTPPCAAASGRVAVRRPPHLVSISMDGCLALQPRREAAWRRRVEFPTRGALRHLLTKADGAVEAPEPPLADGGNASRCLRPPSPHAHGPLGSYE